MIRLLALGKISADAAKLHQHPQINFINGLTVASGHTALLGMLPSLTLRTGTNDEMSAAKNARGGQEEDELDQSLIICETESRMCVVKNVALALGETNYVPFKLLFVEGVGTRGR
jgi:hypothetical protein